MNFFDARWARYGRPVLVAVTALSLAACTTTQSMTTTNGQTQVISQTFQGAGAGCAVAAVGTLLFDHSAALPAIATNCAIGAAVGGGVGLAYGMLFGSTAGQPQAYPVQPTPVVPQQPTQQEVYNMTTVTDNQGRTWVRRANRSLPPECRDTDNWGREWSLDPRDCFVG